MEKLEPKSIPAAETLVDRVFALIESRERKEPKRALRTAKEAPTALAGAG